MNTKTIKTKIEDWYDDLVFNLRHIRGNTRAFFTGLGRWFSYFKILVNVYDFDYSSIIVVERRQITRVRDAIIKYQSHVNWERDVDHINLALKLLDIIEEDGCSERVGKPITFEPIEGTNLSRMVEDPNEYWKLPVYVNTRNSKRYWPSLDPKKFEDPRSGNLWKDHLRVEKAWQLYHKLKMYHMREWWD